PNGQTGSRAGVQAHAFAATGAASRRKTPADQARYVTIRERHPDAASVVPIHTGGHSGADAAQILTAPPPTAYACARARPLPPRTGKTGHGWVIARRQLATWTDDLPEATSADVTREHRRLTHAARRRLAPGARRDR